MGSHLVRKDGGGRVDSKLCDRSWVGRESSDSVKRLPVRVSAVKPLSPEEPLQLSLVSLTPRAPCCWG